MTLQCYTIPKINERNLSNFTLPPLQRSSNQVETVTTQKKYKKTHPPPPKKSEGLRRNSGTNSADPKNIKKLTLPPQKSLKA